MSSRSLYPLFAAIALCALAAAPPAGGEPATPTRPTAPTSPTARMARAVPVQPVSRPRWREEQSEAKAIDARARAEVSDLLQRMRGVPDGPARRELEARVVEIKRKAEVRRAAAVAEYSRAPARPASVANWPDDGVPVCTYPSDQRPSGIAADGAGGCIVVWEDDRHSPQQIYAQRLDASGSRLWTLDGVRVAPTGAGQYQPRVLAEPDGGALIVWADYRGLNADIYAQRLTPAGAVAPGWAASGVPLSTDPKDELNAAMLADGAGGAFVAFEYAYTPGIDVDIHANRVDGNGAIFPGWPANGIVVTGATYHQTGPVIAGDGEGGAFVAWTDAYPSSGAERDVVGSRITPSGTVAAGWGAVGQLLCVAPGEQRGPSVVGSSGATAIVAWEDGRNGFRNDDIFAQRVGGDGSLLWGASGVEVCSAPQDQAQPQLCSDGSGGVIAAWEDARAGYWAIYAQRLGGSGGSLWTGGGQQVCSAQGYYSNSAEIATDGQGGVVIVWADSRSGGARIYAQHLAASGRHAWPGVGLAVCTADGIQNSALATADGAGGAILAWRDFRSVSPGIYARQVTGLSNLKATGAAPVDSLGGPGCDAVVPPVLSGNSSKTWLTWTFWQQGPNPIPSSSSSMLLDEDDSWTFPYVDGLPATYWCGWYPDPIFVRGGRHSLTSIVDVFDEVPESNEADNVWRGQWVWSPLPLARNVPVLRVAPPERGGLPYPNSDGMQFTRVDPDIAWVVSLAARATGDDYDLYVYDDYAGSNSGFSHQVGYSGYGSNATDYVVGHSMGTPTTVYPAAVRFDPAGGGHRFFMDATDALGHRSSSPPASRHQIELSSGRLADVYEMYMVSGVGYGFTVVREQGQSDLEIRVFPPASGGVYGQGEEVGASIPVGPDVSQLAYAATATGWHPVVVSRTTGDYAVFASQYTLFWNEGSPVDVPRAAGKDFELSFRGAAPNPARGSATLEYSLSEAAPVRLEVFDLRGRLVRTLVSQTMAAGPHRATWDCRDDRGVLLGPAIYWARFTAQGRKITRRITVLR